MRKQTLRNLFLLLGLSCIGLIAFGSKTAQAANPNLINFQGKVVAGTGATNPGTNVSDGSYTFRFCLYSTATPTTPCTAIANNDAIWRESKSLTVTSGVFQTELGDVTTLPDFSANSAFYLGVNFNGDSAGEMLPRIHLDSAPYAKYSDNSGQLGGLAATNFVQLAQGLQTDSSTTNDSIAIDKTGATANIVTLKRGGTIVFLLDTNGALTLTPKGNNIGTIVRQTSGTATSGNIFDVQGANGTSHFIQVAETAANAGSISITSLGSNAVTIDSGSGTVVYGSTTTTIQKSGSAFTVDVSNGASDSTLTIANSGGAGNIQLKLDSGGTFAVGAAVGQSTSCGSGQALTNSTYSGGILTTTGTCSSVGGGGTFATTYDTTTPANNKITYSNSGGGALIIQDAPTPLTNLLTVQSSTASKYLLLTNVSTVPHLEVFATNGTDYADIYFDSTNNTAVFSGSSGKSTTIGSGSGPVSIDPGGTSAFTIVGHAASSITTDTSSALTITAAAASTWSTSAGLLTLQGTGGVSVLSATTTTATIDSGTTGSVVVGATNTTNAKAVSVGNANSGSTLTLEAGTANGSLAIGNGATAHDIEIGTNATGANTVSVGGTNASSTLTLEAGTASGSLAIGNGSTAHNIQIGSGAAVQTVVVGSQNSTSKLTLQGGTVTTTNNNSGIIIGSGFSNDATLVGLTLDTANSFNETGSTCTSTVNQGTIYYNNVTNALRSCIGSSNSTASWEDVVTTSGMGLLLFGVVPDSATNLGNVGDLAGIGASGANGSGPCKVYIGSTTATIRWTACVAYSGGRKVVVAAQSTDFTPPKSTSGTQWDHICLTGTNNAPVSSPSAAGTGAENANLPTFSANNPILCLADVSVSTTAVTGIYDTRTFTTTDKDFVNVTTATSVGLGTTVITSGTGVVTAGASATANLVGVIVSWGGATTGAPNAIVATQGPVWAKATAGTAGAVVIPSATAGRVATGTSVAGPYGDLGLQRSITWSATCTAATASTCQLSDFFDMTLR